RNSESAMPPASRTRSFTLLVISLILAGLTVALGNSTASAAGPGPDRAHPFSDPVWFPIHAPVRAGCIGSASSNNGPRSGFNGCAHDHVGYFAMNISIPWKLPGNIVNPHPHPPVYAAGAGVVVSVITGFAPCLSHGAPEQSGNQVWIAHGGGVISVYQHLLSVTVRDGALVTPRTVIGTAGSTGVDCVSGGQPATAYLDFQVRHNGGQGVARSVTISALRACSGTSNRAVAVPASVPRSMYVMPRGQYLPTALPRSWVQVPSGAGIQFAPSDWNCVPSSGYGTPGAATGLRVSRSGTARTLHWSAVPGANGYGAQLELLRAGTWVPPCPAYQVRGCTVGYYTLATTATPHLTLTGVSGHVTYRVRVSVHNPVGYSAATGWVTVR
ncbi:MAG: peptidoglycan DD-metalloendopeptidase family protein, partial [Jatrophihabitantaceae bacterium]